MTTQVATRRIDVDTHFYPPVDYKALRAYLPRGLVAQAQDMLVRDAMRAAEPERVAAETSGALPPSRHGADPFCVKLTHASYGSFACMYHRAIPSTCSVPLPYP